MFFEGKIAGSGFTHVPGGDDYKNRSAYAYHYYCGSLVQNWEGKPELTKYFCDDVLANLVYESVDEEIKKFGGASMMTEFGGCPENNLTIIGECNVVMNKADKRLDSWTDYTHA